MSETEPKNCVERIQFEQVCTPVEGSPNDLRCESNYRVFEQCAGEQERLVTSEQRMWGTKRSWSQYLTSQAKKNLDVDEFRAFQENAWKDIKETANFIKEKLENFGRRRD